MAEHIIAVVDWRALRAASGNGERVGVGLSRLLSAPTHAEVEEAYWQIENHAVAQGSLFEAAETTVSVLVAAFADERPRHVRIAALELLFQCLNPGAGPAADGAPRDIVERCHRAAREGAWGLVREAAVGERRAAVDVLNALGSDGLSPAVLAALAGL